MCANLPWGGNFWYIWVMVAWKNSEVTHLDGHIIGGTQVLDDWPAFVDQFNKRKASVFLEGVLPFLGAE